MDCLWRSLSLLTAKETEYCIAFMQGARWDTALGTLQESKLKELHPQMPVIHIKAVTQETFVSYFSISMMKW